MKKLYVFITACGFLTGVSFSQNVKYCGTDEAELKLRADHPEIAEYEKQLAQQEQNKVVQPQALPPVYIIPIVFHILHNNGVENISDAQIYDEMRILNEDFRKLNADTSAIVASFKAIAADAEIEFRLARKDPSGNCTNGIDRIATPETYIGDNGSKLNQWPRDKYLNVWIVNSISSGVAGYAYRPSSAASFPAIDGIMILHDYVGSIGTGNVSFSRTLTHEIGHYLNLCHPWSCPQSNAGITCGDDGVGDTPITRGWTSCNLSGSVCNPPIIENVQNFMEYAFCEKMFTANQATRMRNALLSGISSRNNLWTAANLSFTGISLPDVLCTADFTVTKQSLCQTGDSVQFSDNSWNGNPTSWNWTFTGGVPSTSTDSTPWVTYSTPGEYNVSYTATNTSGSPSITKNNYIVVNSNTAQYSSPFYSEGFEISGPLPSADWKITSNAGPAWSQNTSVAYTGTKSMWLDNFSAATGDVEVAYSPTINLSLITNPKLYFRMAYAQKVSTDNDALKVFVSTDCGLTWSPRYTKSGTTLSTIAPGVSPFVPTVSQWRLDSVGIAPYVTSTNFMFKFEFTSRGGNNIFIDDINVTTIGTVSIPEISNDFQFSIFPNPLENNSTVSFSLTEKQKVNVKLFDVLGREVFVLTNGELSAGKHQYNINGKMLNSGIYFIKFTAGEKTAARKVIVN